MAYLNEGRRRSMADQRAIKNELAEEKKGGKGIVPLKMGKVGNDMHLLQQGYMYVPGHLRGVQFNDQVFEKNKKMYRDLAQMKGINKIPTKDLGPLITAFGERMNRGHGLGRFEQGKYKQAMRELLLKKYPQLNRAVQNRPFWAG